MKKLYNISMNLNKVPNDPYNSSTTTMVRGTTVGCGTLSNCENPYKGVTLIGFNLTIDDRIDRKLYSMYSSLVSALNQETMTK